MRASSPGDHKVVRIDYTDIPVQVVHIAFRIRNKDQVTLGSSHFAVCLVDDDFGFAGAFRPVNYFDHRNLRKFW